MTDLQRLERAIRRLYKCDCTHRESVPVHEHLDRLAWEGVVEMFALSGHRDAKLAYAWTSPTAGGTTVTSVLGVGPVKSAQDAVRAVLAAQQTEQAPARRTPRRRPPTTPGPEDAGPR